MKGSIWGVSIVATLLVFGATAINFAVPSSPADSTDAVAAALEPLGSMLLVLLLLTTVGVVFSTMRRSF